MKMDIIYCIDTLDYLIYLNITGLRFGNCKVDVLRNGHQGQIGQFPATVWCINAVMQWCSFGEGERELDKLGSMKTLPHSALVT